MKMSSENFRVWRDAEGKLVAIMEENGHDTIFQTKRATVEFKDKLFTLEEKV